MGTAVVITDGMREMTDEELLAYRDDHAVLARSDADARDELDAAEREIARRHRTGWMRPEEEGTDATS